jgi:hypothetical protein
MKSCVLFIYLFIGLVYCDLNEDDYFNLNFDNKGEKFASNINFNDYNINNEPSSIDQIPFNEFDSSSFPATNDEFSSELDKQIFDDQQQPPIMNEISQTNQFFPEFFDFHQELYDYFGNDPELKNDAGINFDLYQTPPTRSNVIIDNSNDFYNFNSINENINSNRVGPAIDLFDQLIPNSNNNVKMFSSQTPTQNINPSSFISPWFYTFRAEEAGITYNNKYSTILSALTQNSSTISTSIMDKITKDISKTTTTSSNSIRYNITNRIENFTNISNFTLPDKKTLYSTNSIVYNLKNGTNSYRFKQNRTDTLKKGISFENSPKLDDMYDSESLPNLDHSQLAKSNSMHFVEKRIHSDNIFPNGR